MPGTTTSSGNVQHQFISQLQLIFQQMRQKVGIKFYFFAIVFFNEYIRYFSSNNRFKAAIYRFYVIKKTPTDFREIVFGMEEESTFFRFFQNIGNAFVIRIPFYFSLHLNNPLSDIM